MFKWLYRNLSAKLLRVSPDDPALETAGMSEREALKRLLQMLFPRALLRNQNAQMHKHAVRTAATKVLSKAGAEDEERDRGG